MVVIHTCLLSVSCGRIKLPVHCMWKTTWVGAFPQKIPLLVITFAGYITETLEQMMTGLKNVIPASGNFAFALQPQL